MSRREHYQTQLRELGVTAWPDYLTAHSGLPGPRANIELAQALADEADPGFLDRLLSTGDEYLVFCATIGLGRLLAEGVDVEQRLRAYATDPRWRVREAVAMALQRLGDTDPARLFHLAAGWVADPEPLVQRAAVAAVCEPRLIETPDAAAHALELCAQATQALADLPATKRHNPDVRTLRQALGYCWSVAIAAAPAVGIPRFQALANSSDPDVAWIVRENSKKARLAKLL